MAGENYYSFTSFIRKGYANSIQGVSDLSEKKNASSILMRASIQAQISLKLDAGTELLPANTIHLYGPGDVSGIDSRSIIRNDPPEGITNFEPNYLAAIEFYEEDLPWRFSPAAQNNSIGTSTSNPRLSPWLALVVLEEKEFNLIPVSSDSDSGLLPSFQLSESAKRNEIFCNSENLHAWAHVHTNQDLITKATANGTAPTGNVLSNLTSLMDDNGDFCYSRILCPRRLKTKTSYQAFLIPVFETGRLAGLGLYDQSISTPVNQGSWDNDQSLFPFYYSWKFATGNAGDFEYLARQLKPKAADVRTGYREIVAEGIQDGSEYKILQMPGALRAPLDTLDPGVKQSIKDYENWEAPQNPHPWQSNIAGKLNIQLDQDKEPVITMPLYGQWHAATDEILYQKSDGKLLPASIRNNWIHELNLDPRYRAAAALGTKVIQKYQEEFMDAAWQQLDELKLVNEKINRLQLAVELNNIIIKKSLKRFEKEQLLGFGNLLTKKVKGSNGKTLFAEVNQSPIPNALVSNLFKKVSRNTWRIQKVGKNGKQVFSTPIISNLNLEKLQINSLNVKNLNLSFSSIIDQSIQNTMAAELKFKALKPTEQILAKQKLNLALGMKKDFTDSLKVSPPSFKIQSPKSLLSSKTVQLSLVKSIASNDFSIFKNAAINKNIGLEFSDSYTAEKSISLTLTQTLDTLLKGLEALPRLKSRLDQKYPLSKDYWSGYSEQFYPVMDYPEFNLPMYSPLIELSEENFVPNLQLLKQNSVTLLETNQRFIEAYLIGLNHEFSRELLWRGFPTDQKGSYFRCFWDSLSEKKDIEEIHRWNKTLGNNGNSSTQGLLVLTLRGDLLRKYPNTIVYAQKAAWDGSVTKDRVLDSGSEPVFPDFEAKVAPDIYMLGFSLNEKALLGTENPTATTDDAGWFFVLQERPGEPRFGLDEQNASSLKNWNDLSWDKVGTENGKIVDFKKSILMKKTGDDIQASWPPKDSAQLAYIFHQQPVMVSIHASRLLK